jgi:diguanylate cyclase (GGDEF)-like protein/PAS domain S-box-containing protein
MGKATRAWRWLLPLLALLLVVDAQLWSMVQRNREQALQQARDVLRTASQVVLGRAEQTFNIYERTLTGISEVIGSREGLRPTPDLDLHRLLVRRHAITAGLHLLFLVRDDGSLAEISTEFPAPRLNVSNREYFQASHDNWDGGLHISPAILSRVDDYPIIPISHRLSSDGERFLGVAAAGIDPEALQRLISEQTLPPGFRLTLLLRSGEALACLPRQSDCLAQRWQASPLVQTLLPVAPEGQGDGMRLLDESPGLAAYDSSDRYPLVVAASADLPAVLVPWQHSLAEYLLLGLGSNLALVGITFYAWRQAQRRRQALAELAEANLRLEERVARRTEALARSETRARLFMNTAMDAVVVIDDESRIVEFNNAAVSMFGYRTEEVLGQSLNLLMPEAEAARHGPRVRAAGTGDESRLAAKSLEVSARHKDGRELPVEVTVGSAQVGERRLHVGIIRDIGERKQVEQELQRLATTDGLTGTLNRRAFTGEAERLVALALRHQRPLTLLLLDADKFKNINDSHGHPVGDRVLQALARCLAAQLRTSDVLGRLGGEEFGIVLPETGPEGALEVGERLLTAVRQCRVLVGEGDLGFTVSIGATCLGQEAGASLEQAFRLADEALYAAKAQGRNCIVLKVPEVAA